MSMREIHDLIEKAAAHARKSPEERRPIEWEKRVAIWENWLQQNDYDDAGQPDRTALLCRYFAKRRAGHPDAAKGLLLMGNTGVGKTRTMNLMRLADGGLNAPILVTAQEIVQLWEWQPEEARRQYGISSRELIIDDLGEETQARHFGKDENALGQMLIMRERMFLQSGVRTHITTNLSVSQLKERYGERVFSRLKGMCHWLTLTGPDRRLPLKADQEMGKAAEESR